MFFFSITVSTGEYTNCKPEKNTIFAPCVSVFPQPQVYIPKSPAAGGGETIYALQGLKRPQKTVRRLRKKEVKGGTICSNSTRGVL